jgi:decaprenylphospho-beta-D-ribofuranose 2-oxidase
MSVADEVEARPAEPAAARAPVPAAPGHARRMAGWGRVVVSRARIVSVREAEEIADVLSREDLTVGGVIARDAGRIYGDAAQIAGGTVIDMTGLDRVLEIDAERRCVRVQAGVTYAALLAELVPRGFMLPSVPGTRHVTIGGAIASDVHGKNHPHAGSIGHHVRGLRLCTPAGGLRDLAPDLEGDRELLLAALGGMGLVGVVAEATLAIERLPAPWWALDTDRTASLEDTLALMARDEGHRFSVAWLDLLARGARLGRAIVTRSNEWPADRLAELPQDGPQTSRLPGGARLNVPRAFPGSLLAPPLIAAFNELRWRMSPRRERGRAVPLPPHFFPLDGIGEWNRLYGARGLVQYQFAVPDGAQETLVRSVELLRAHRVPSYLAVLKRFGRPSGAPLSFPIPGWTLALDIPAWAADLRPALDRVDELVAGAGGRVYLTKDVRLRRDLLGAMYPKIDRFTAARALADPDGILRSDLGARLGLCRSPR